MISDKSVPYLDICYICFIIIQSLDVDCGWGILGVHTFFSALLSILFETFLYFLFQYIYVGEARSLKTYGVTFYLVKEKMKGKNKLVPRLLGVTKDSVLRLDEKTKEILKTWPLTTVRRWAASPNTFTLGKLRNFIKNQKP